MRAFTLMLFVFLIFLPAPGQAGETYTRLKASEIPNVILDQSGKRRVVFVYTSWCPYCRAAMPAMVALSQKQRGAVIALSVDKDPDKLERYLSQYTDQGFQSHIWDRTGDLAGALGRFGIRLNGGIPFSALLDESGQVVKQGNLEVEEITRYILGGRQGQQKQKKDI